MGPDQRFLKAMRIVPYDIGEGARGTDAEYKNRKLASYLSGMRLIADSANAIASKRAKVIAEKEYQIEQLEDRIKEKDAEIGKAATRSDQWRGLALACLFVIGTIALDSFRKRR